MKGRDRGGRDRAQGGGLARRGGELTTETESRRLTEIAMGLEILFRVVWLVIKEKKFKLDHDKPRIFSPFGLGVLDLAVGKFCTRGSNIVRRGDRVHLLLEPRQKTQDRKR